MKKHLFDVNDNIVDITMFHFCERCVALNVVGVHLGDPTYVYDIATALIKMVEFFGDVNTPE